MNAPLDLDAIKARVEAATPGPWDAQPFGEFGWDIFAGLMTDENAEALTNGVNGDGAFPKMEDAELCAHAREDVPALIAEIERLRARCDELEDAIAGKLDLVDVVHSVRESL